MKKNQDQKAKRSESLDEKIKLRLSTKFMLSIILLECLLMIAITLLVEHQMRKSVLDEFLKRGLSISRNLAAINIDYVATYNYINIEQNVKRVKNQNDLFYAVVIFYDGEVASYEGPEDLKKEILSGTLHEKSLKIKDTLVQYDEINGEEFCDIAVPVFLKEENFGTVRCGFSLSDIHSAILKTRQLLLGLGVLGLLLGCVASLFLARRITRPIQSLVKSVEAISEGEYDHEIKIKTHDEIAYLGRRFDSMKNTVKENIQMMVQTNLELTNANKKLSYEINERKRTEEALRTAKKAAEVASVVKSQFLTNVSHELRTPMNGIIGMTELILSTELSDRQKELAYTLYRSGEGLLSIINSVLDFSSMEVGKLSLLKKDFNLLETVEETIEFMAESIDNKDIELISMTYHDVPKYVKGDTGRLRQILMNLIGNAIKFTEKGEVRLNVRFVKEKENKLTIRFEIIDTGIGIEKNVREAIFEIFSQADTSLTRQYEGLGLGLTIAKQLTEMMNGDIHLESEPGEGSTFFFTVCLDACSQSQEDIEKDKENLDALKNLRVIVAVPNPSSSSVLLYHLSDWGVQYVQAENGEEVLEVLKKNAKDSPFNAIITSMDLPDMDGVALARRIKSNPYTTSVPSIILVPVNQRDAAQEARMRHFKYRLTKPVAQSQIYGALTELANIQANIKIDSQDQNICISPYKESFEQFEKIGTDEEQANISNRPTPRPGYHVLIVEDNPVNLEIAREKLKLLGFSVDSAQNGKEAVLAYEKNHYDLVAMDCQMPIMDGYEATRVIREKEEADNSGTHIPIFAITAHAMEGDRERCLNAGMDDYLSKPFTIKQLKEIVNRLLPEMAA